MRKYLAGVFLFIMFLMAVKPKYFIVEGSPASWDIWNRIVFGTSVTMHCILIGVVIAGFIPIITGIMVGYYNNRKILRNIVSWFWDILEMFPIILIAITADYLFYKNYYKIIAVISLFLIPRFSRVIESKAKGIQQKEFVQIAKMNNLSDLQIIRKHVFPLLKNTIMYNLSGCIGSIILLLTAIGFIDLALLPGAKSWGFVLRSNVPDSISGFFNLGFLLPLAYIIFAIFSFFLASESFKETGIDEIK